MFGKNYRVWRPCSKYRTPLQPSIVVGFLKKPLYIAWSLAPPSKMPLALGIGTEALTTTKLHISRK